MPSSNRNTSPANGGQATPRRSRVVDRRLPLPTKINAATTIQQASRRSKWLKWLKKCLPRRQSSKSSTNCHQLPPNQCHHNALHCDNHCTNNERGRRSRLKQQASERGAKLLPRRRTGDYRDNHHVSDTHTQWQRIAITRGGGSTSIEMDDDPGTGDQRWRVP